MNYKDYMSVENGTLRTKYLLETDIKTKRAMKRALKEQAKEMKRDENGFIIFDENGHAVRK